MNESMNNALARKMQRVEALIDSLEKLSNPAARIVAQELVHTLLALHEAGLARIMEIAEQTGGDAAITAWGRDDVVGSLLMLHGLHPVSMETRARQAIEQIQPVLRYHGGELELVAVSDKLIRIRLRGACSLSPQELEHSLQEAFAASAPDVRVIEVENTDTPAQRIALPML